MRTRRGSEAAFLLAWGVMWAAGGATMAADPPPTAALDRMLYDALKDMHNRAADLYNAGDPNGCYRMFQGGLLMAKPLLAHRPDVQQLIDQGMQNADRDPSIPRRAQLLHKTIEEVRSRVKPPAAVKPPETPGTTNPPPTSTTPPNPNPARPPASSAPPLTGGPPLEPPATTPPAADTLWK